MRFHAIPAIRNTVFALCGALLSVPAPADGIDASDVVIKEHQSGSGDAFFAVAMRPQGLSAEKTSRHIVLVDTSASQIGTARDSSLRLVHETISRLHGQEIHLVAVDIDCQSLTGGFVNSDSREIKTAIKSLELRTPLGTTDLEAALSFAAEQADDARTTSVLYIGDGFSANRIPAARLKTLTNALVQKRVAVHSLILGPKTNQELPAILANLTGGTIASPARGTEQKASETVAKAIQSTPVSVTEIHAGSESLQLASQQTILLRSDRHTVVFGRGQVTSNSLAARHAKTGVSVTWSQKDISRKASGAELKHFVTLAEQQHGVNAPIVNLEALDAAGKNFEKSMARSLKSARILSDRGQITEARQVLNAAAQFDDSNKELRMLLTSLPGQNDENAAIVPTPDGNVNPNPAFGGGQAQQANPLEDVAARVNLQSQVLAAKTNNAIEQANLLSAEQPEYATSILKGILETVQSSADISPDVRSELERRVIAAIGEVSSRVAINALVQKQIARDEAVREAQKRLLEEERVLESRLEIQIEKIRGLLDRGRHGDINAFEDAEFESRITLDQKPASGPATQALVMSEALGQLDKAYRLINLRHDRFLEVLYQVELSHVPFPDEPPILYPPADVWRALTLTRKPRYESSDLRSEAPVEKWLRQMLDKPVRNLDFPGDVPLSEILDTIESYFTSTYGAGVGDSGTDFKMTIYPDKGELGLEQIDSLEDITISDISFDGMTLRNALKLIFEQTLDDTKSPVPLTYVIQDEVMKITTKDKAESADNLVTRVYPVADLVIPPSAAQQLGGGGGLGGGQQGGGFGGGQQGGGFGGGQQGGGFGGGGQGFMSLPPEM